MHTKVLEASWHRCPRSQRRPTASNRLPGSNRLPRRSLLLGGLAAGVATLLAAGCASPKRTAAKQLLESIAKANRRHSIARKKFTDIVSARLQESATTTDDDVAAGLEKLKAETRTIQEESEAWPVPTEMEAESLMIDDRGRRLPETRPAPGPAHVCRGDGGLLLRVTPKRQRLRAGASAFSRVIRSRSSRSTSSIFPPSRSVTWNPSTTWSR